MDEMALLVIAPEDGDAYEGAVDADEYQLCANLYLAECNWLVKVEPVRRLCISCRLARTHPNDADTSALAAFAVAEKAKRRLIAELHELELPIVGRDKDPEYGLAFDLLSIRLAKVGNIRVRSTPSSFINSRRGPGSRYAGIDRMGSP